MTWFVCSTHFCTLFEFALFTFALMPDPPLRLWVGGPGCILQAEVVGARYAPRVFG
jgi:hypothetical protein